MTDRRGSMGRDRDRFTLFVFFLRLRLHGMFKQKKNGETKMLFGEKLCPASQCGVWKMFLGAYAVPWPVCAIRFRQTRRGRLCGFQERRSFSKSFSVAWRNLAQKFQRKSRFVMGGVRVIKVFDLMARTRL